MSLHESLLHVARKQSLVAYIFLKCAMNVVNGEEGEWPVRSEEGACFINMRKSRDPELSLGCVLYKYQEARAPKL